MALVYQVLFYLHDIYKQNSVSVCLKRTSKNNMIKTCNSISMILLLNNTVLLFYSYIFNISVKLHTYMMIYTLALKILEMKWKWTEFSCLYAAVCLPLEDSCGITENSVTILHCQILHKKNNNNTKQRKSHLNGIWPLF